MTNEERKLKVIQLKKNGSSYKEISTMLDIPLGTVKSILSRVNDFNKNSSSCKNCGKTIISIKGKKVKVFCSDKCRLTWWNNNRDKGDKRIYIKKCHNCNEQFKTFDFNKKYCSHNCYIENRYKLGTNND